MFVCPNNSGIIKLGQRPKRGSSAIQEFCFISFHSSVLQFCLWENNQECSLICLEAEAWATPRAWLPVRDSHLRSSRHFYYLLSLWFPLPFWAQSTQRSHCMKSMTSRIALLMPWVTFMARRTAKLWERNIFGWSAAQSNYLWKPHCKTRLIPPSPRLINNHTAWADFWPRLPNEHLLIACII